MKGSRRCTHSLACRQPEYIGESAPSARPDPAKEEAKCAFRTGSPLDYTRHSSPGPSRRAPMPLIRPLGDTAHGPSQGVRPGAPERGSAGLRTPRSSACCFASHLHSKLWVDARTRPHPYADPCGSSTHTPEALQFCHCPCQARLAPQVFSPMNTPTSTGKNPSPHPGSDHPVLQKTILQFSGKWEKPNWTWGWNRTPLGL